VYLEKNSVQKCWYRRKRDNRIQENKLTPKEFKIKFDEREQILNYVNNY
jgi:hypothetical protein